MTNIGMNAIVCSQCGRHRASVCCICTYPPYLLCPSDMQSHVQKSLDQGQFHLMVDPTAYTEKQEVIELKKAGFVRLGTAHRRLREKLTAIQLAHKNLIEQAFESAQKQLQDLKNAEIQRLQSYVDRISRLVEKAIYDTSFHALSPQPPRTIFEEFIARPAEPQDPWFRLQVAEELVVLQQAVKAEYSSEFTYVQECFEREASLPAEDLAPPRSAESLYTFPSALGSPDRQPLASEYPMQAFHTVRNPERRSPFQVAKCDCGLMAVKGGEKCVFCMDKRAKISEGGRAEERKEVEGRLERSRLCDLCRGTVHTGERVCRRCQIDMSALSDTVSNRVSLIPGANSQYQQFFTGPPQIQIPSYSQWQCSFCGSLNDEKQAEKCGNCNQMRKTSAPKSAPKASKVRPQCEKCHITETTSADPQSGRFLCIRCIQHKATEHQPTQWKCSLCRCYNPARADECIKCSAKRPQFLRERGDISAEEKRDIEGCEQPRGDCLKGSKDLAFRHFEVKSPSTETSEKSKKNVQ